MSVKQNQEADIFFWLLTHQYSIQSNGFNYRTYYFLQKVSYKKKVILLLVWLQENFCTYAKIIQYWIYLRLCVFVCQRALCIILLRSDVISCGYKFTWCKQFPIECMELNVCTVWFTSSQYESKLGLNCTVIILWPRTPPPFFFFSYTKLPFVR